MVKGEGFQIDPLPAIGLFLSLSGTYFYSRRKGAAVLDNRLRKRIKEKDVLLRNLQGQLTAPRVSPLEQSRRDLVEKELTTATPLDLEVVTYVLRHGEIDPIVLATTSFLQSKNQHEVQQAINRGLSTGLLKHIPAPPGVPSFRQFITVKPELRDALSFHLLND
jgi:hypothetical protein